MRAVLPVIVIGASTGGVEALCDLVAALPDKLPAAVCIVQHIGPNSSVLPNLLRRLGPLPAVHAHDGQDLRAGMIYVAPPALHLLLEDHKWRTSHGPKENHTRPAIDPLFRSAAQAFGQHVIGVVLTGQLDDGAAGLRAIKDCGGVAIVQDPEDALERQMPESALRATRADFCLPLAEIPAKLVELAERARTAASPGVPELVTREVLMNRGADSMQHLPDIADPATLTCPDCGGALWELRDKRPLRYRCHTGHAFSALTLAKVQMDAAEHALWASVRSQREKAMLLQRVAELAEAAGDKAQATAARQEAQSIQDKAARLRALAEAEPEGD